MTKPVTRESRAQGCTWLFGRGASIASGLPWVVPSAWKDDLASGRVARDAHVQMVIDAIRDGISKLPTEGTPYRRLLDMMATRTVDQGHHRLMTTNWDYLLQRDLTNWVEANWPGWAPRFLSTHGSVYHFNGSAEPGDFKNRSPFMLETDSASVRRATYEANKAFQYLLWSDLVVIVGMSSECQTDRGLLAALRAHEDNVPIGSALFLIVEPHKETLESTYAKLAACFPRARGLRVHCGFAESIDSGMPELIGEIFARSVSKAT
jgi:hypothetical protein